MVHVILSSGNAGGLRRHADDHCHADRHPLVTLAFRITSVCFTSILNATKPSINTRYADGRAGNATSRCPCWPHAPCASPCGCAVKVAPEGSGAAQWPEKAPVAVPPTMARRSLHRARARLVHMTPHAPVSRPAVPLPATRLRISCFSLRL